MQYSDEIVHAFSMHVPSAWQRFKSACTLHGVTDVDLAPSAGERSFWIGVLLVGSSLTVVQIVSAVRQFRDVQPKTRVEDVAYESLAFPKVHRG